MATRAMGLSQNHVQALNAIDLEFQGKRFKQVRESWKSYLDHLGDYPKGDDVENKLPVWNDKKSDLLAELLMVMGKPLGYDFDVVHIKKGIYIPEGHAQIETEQALIRAGIVQLLYGNLSLKMDVNSFPSDKEALEQHKRLSAELLRTLSASSEGVPVTILSRSGNEKGTA